MLLSLFLFATSCGGDGYSTPNYPNVSPYSDYEVVYNGNDNKLTDKQEETFFNILDSLTYNKSKIEDDSNINTDKGILILQANRHLKEDSDDSLLIEYRINLFNGIVLRRNPLISSFTSDEYAQIGSNDLTTLKKALSLDHSFNLKTNIGSFSNSLITSLKSSYKFGELVDIKIHPLYDADMYIYINDEYKANRYHSDYDYRGYRFYMPAEDVTLTFSGDKFYLDRYYSFNEVFSWANQLSLDEIKKVSLEEGYIGVNPDTQNNEVYFSKDSQDIKSVFNITKQLLKKADKGTIDGGWYKKYILYLGDIEYEILIENNYLTLTSFSSYDRFTFANESYNLPKISNSME